MQTNESKKTKISHFHTQISPSYQLCEYPLKSFSLHMYVYLFCQNDKMRLLLRKLFFFSQIAFPLIQYDGYVQIFVIDSAMALSAGLSKLLANLGLYVVSIQIGLYSQVSFGGDGDWLVGFCCVLIFVTFLLK